jgi:4-amino-4-deoxy-L-arabinose transferase-like glycosyltransferase
MQIILNHSRWAIFLTVLVNAASMLTPIINEGDSVIYAALSQHMATHGNWIDLILNGTDWLDKPHFPFWLTALSFKVGGISAFTYILPGFLFHLIGGYFTYRIARLLYGRNTALLALLVYVSVYHLMYSSIAVKAEAFLTGSITGACYYWLRFDTSSKLKHLLLGALFTAISMMTKGVFTLITIGSGFVCLWIYQRRWHNFVSAKWLLALTLSLVLTAPELTASYMQFDAHPEKLVFGRSHVSGIRLFLWDSQFGRFFNSGPITNQNGNPLYFVHVFLWAFLPWVAVFVAALYTGVRGFSSLKSRDRENQVFCGSAFLVTFILFSATKYQMDYYTVIVFPFAAIICADYLARWQALQSESKALIVAQWIMVFSILTLTTIFAFYVAQPLPSFAALAMACLLLTYALLNRHQVHIGAVLILPVLAINVLYVFLDTMVFVAHTTYSIPYNVKKLVPGDPAVPIYFYQMDPMVHLEMGLYSQSPCFALADLSQIPTNQRRYILVAKEGPFQTLVHSLGSIKPIGQGAWIDDKTGVLPRILAMAKGSVPTDQIRVVEVTGRH